MKSRGFATLAVAVLTLMLATGLARSQDVAAAVPATQPLTRTVGVDIVKMTINPDQTRTLLFRWKDKQGNNVERSVIVNQDTVIGIGGKLSTMADLTEDRIHRDKAVATCGPDMTTAVSLRLGRAMIRIAREQLTPTQIANLQEAAPKATPASDAAMAGRVNEWVDALGLADAARASRVKEVITTHLRNVRDAHNAGFAPETSSHKNFVNGLMADLTPEQTEAIKDKITINKVSVTFNAYHQIVPGLTAQEDQKILELLKAAREESLDVKNAEEMAVVFEGYKKQIENYLTANGHDWKTLYKQFSDTQRANRDRPTTQPAPTH